MNDRPDAGLVVTRWLRASAPPRAPERVLSAALDRVAGTGQARPLGGRRFDAWISRSPRLHWAIVGVLLAAALLGAIAGVGALLRQSRVLPSSVSNGWVAFAVQADVRHGDSDIDLVKNGVALRRIIGFDGDGLRQVCPSFSPDGTKLAYAEAPVGLAAPGEVAVVIVTLDDAGQPVGPVLRLAASSFNDVCPKWAPDGQAVAFIANEQQPDGGLSPTSLWIGRLDGTEARVAGWEATGGGGRFDWSPDATAVVGEGGDGTSIWIVPLDGRPARLLRRAGPGVLFEQPKWSPDGTRIAVMADVFVQHADGSGSITGSSVEVYRADGSGSPIDLGSGGDPAWSPDGHRIAFVRVTASLNGPSLYELVTVAPEADDARVAASESHVIRGFVWSPDGTQLVYVADGATSGGVLSVPALGGSSPAVLTQQQHYLEFTSSDQISIQPVFR